MNENGESTKLGAQGIWTGAVKMTALGSWLYVVQADRLHRINPLTGGYDIISDAA